jgi:protease-4
MSRPLLRTTVVVWSICSSVVVPVVRAQLHRPTDPVATPASAYLEQDDALVIDANPAWLGWTPAFSASYLHSDVAMKHVWVGRGDAVHVATPLLWGLSVGATAQSIRPDSNTQGGHRGMGALALAFAPSSAMSFGATLRTIAASDPSFDGLTTADVGAALRLSDGLQLSVTGRDLFVTRGGQGARGLDLASSLLVGITSRMFGDSRLIIDGQLAVGQHIGGRISLGLPLPGVGRLSGMIESDRFDTDSLRMLGGIEVDWGRAALAGGGMVYENGRNHATGWYGMARISGAERRGLPSGHRVLDLELRGDISPRRWISLALLLQRAAHDSRVSGVLLRPRDTGIGMAAAQELRQLIQEVREQGKPVVCHVDAPSGPEVYACAAADQTWIDPAGGMRLMGVNMTALHLGDLLRNVGLRADFVRIGEYKSAPEQLMQSSMSEPARAQTNQFLDDAHRRLLFDLSKDLDVTQTRAADIIDHGPQLAREAIAFGLASQEVDEIVMDRELADVFGSSPRVTTLTERVPETHGLGARIGVVLVDGNIVDGENVEMPLLGMHMSGGRTVSRSIEALAHDPTVAVIVVRIDSPGGAVLASDQIWRAMRRAREIKPVIASMGGVAASGGYYVASAANEIWADPSTLTGSIGIFFGKVDVVPLADRLGVGIESFQRGAHAGAESIWRPFTDDERAALSQTIRDFYRTFVSRVAEGRDMTPERVDALGQGHIYSGDTALTLGLIDHLGGLASALARARELANLDLDADVVVVPEAPSDLLSYVLGAGASSSLAQANLLPIPTELMGVMQMATTIRHAGPTRPLALLPFAVDFR